MQKIFLDSKNSQFDNLFSFVIHEEWKSAKERQIEKIEKSLSSLESYFTRLPFLDQMHWLRKCWVILNVTDRTTFPSQTKAQDLISKVSLFCKKINDTFTKNIENDLPLFFVRFIAKEYCRSTDSAKGKFDNWSQENASTLRKINRIFYLAIDLEESLYCREFERAKLFEPLTATLHDCQCNRWDVRKLAYFIDRHYLNRLHFHTPESQYTPKVLSKRELEELLQKEIYSLTLTKKKLHSFPTLEFFGLTLDNQTCNFLSKLQGVTQLYLNNCYLPHFELAQKTAKNFSLESLWIIDCSASSKKIEGWRQPNESTLKTVEIRNAVQENSEFGMEKIWHH